MTFVKMIKLAILYFGDADLSQRWSESIEPMLAMLADWVGWARGCAKLIVTFGAMWISCWMPFLMTIARR